MSESQAFRDEVRRVTEVIISGDGPAIDTLVQTWAAFALQDPSVLSTESALSEFTQGTADAARVSPELFVSVLDADFFADRATLSIRESLGDIITFAISEAGYEARSLPAIAGLVHVVSRILVSPELALVAVDFACRAFVPIRARLFEGRGDPIPEEATRFAVAFIALFAEVAGAVVLEAWLDEPEEIPALVGIALRELWPGVTGTALLDACAREVDDQGVDASAFRTQPGMNELPASPGGDAPSTLGPNSRGIDL